MESGEDAARNALAEQLAEQLAELGARLSPAELRRGAAECERLGLSAERFAELWAERQLSAAAAPASTDDGDDVLSAYLTVDPGAEPRNDIAESPSANLSTVKNLKPETYASTVSHSGKYSARTNSGNVLCSFGSEDALNKCIWTNMSGDSCKIQQVPNDSNTVLSSKSMYGFELLQKKASLLDNNIKYLSACILQKANIKDAAPVKCKSQVPVNITGRIDCDANGRLNAKSVLLQGTWEDSMGHNVSIDLDHLKQYSVFPGQIVAMTGTNLRGDKFSAQEFYCDGSLPKPNGIVIDNNINGALQMVVACGPFTTSDSLTYEPMTDLLKYVATNRPHVLILIGPFLDANHQLVSDNVIAETFKSYFDKLVEKIMTAVDTTSRHTQVVLVSSSKDVFHTNIYPTPPFFIRKSYPNLIMAPDPSILNIGGVNIGVTSTDILMHLSKEEISIPLQGPDKLGRLASHLFMQQSFYPLWPPNINLSVDTTLWNEHACMTINPHVLIIPSDFRYFTKEISNCLTINPERLTKGTGPGTFVRLQVNSSDDTNTDNKLCQILRI